MATGGYSSWFSGFASERSDSAVPQGLLARDRSRDEYGMGRADTAKSCQSGVSFKSGATNDTIAEERRDDRRFKLEKARQKEAKRKVELDVPLDKSIPEEIQLALRRSHAMCKLMIQAHEADTMQRIDTMEEEIKRHGDFIADLGMQARTGRVSVCLDGSTPAEASFGTGRRSSAPSIHSSFGGDIEVTQSLKDDVQTIIDAMRVELQKQKEAVASLNEQVRKGPRRSQMGSMFQGLSAAMLGETGDSEATPQQQSLQLQRFNELHMEVKKDIEKLGERIEEGVADSQQYLTKQAFDEFSKKTEQQFENARKGLADVKNSQELVAVKAGFLAVAASECSHEEKDGLFRSLKEQEEECYRKGIGSNPRITEC